MTNKDKQLTIKRILIYLVLSFVPVYLIGILGTDKDCSFKTQFGSLSIMWYPAIANILTRIITKEGFEDSYLHINMKGNKKYYLTAVAAPIVFSVIAGVAEALRVGGDYSFSRGVKFVGGGKMLAASLLMCAVVSVAELDRGFGEEFGWRAYLTPKMEKLMPSPAAITVSGIIWGLWHAPLIAKGYNFGTDVHPAVGITAMCVSCVVLSFILTWLTNKTGSVYPAAIFHIVYDAFMSFICLTIAYGIKGYDNTKHVFSSALIAMVFVPMLGAILACLLMMRKKKA